MATDKIRIRNYGGLKMFKKLLSLMAVIMMCFVLTACGGTGDTGENGNDQGVPNGTGLETADGYFLWEGDVIVGYTEEGLEQTELIIPANCTKVSGLSGNTVVKKITFENPDTIIGSVAFLDCTALEEIILPENLTKLERKTFEGCISLKEIVIPSGVTEIESNVFNGCTSLESVELPDSLTKLGGSAFEACVALESVVFPSMLIEIDHDAFSGCTNLKTVTFSEGLLIIGDQAFSNCDSLTSVVIPEGVTTIGEGAFEYCASLSEIYLPSTITEIDSYSLMPEEQITVYVKAGSYMDGEGWDMLLGGSMETMYVKEYH